MPPCFYINTRENLSVLMPRREVHARAAVKFKHVGAASFEYMRFFPSF